METFDNPNPSSDNNSEIADNSVKFPTNLQLEILGWKVLSDGTIAVDEELDNMQMNIKFQNWKQKINELYEAARKIEEVDILQNKYIILRIIKNVTPILVASGIVGVSLYQIYNYLFGDFGGSELNYIMLQNLSLKTISSFLGSVVPGLSAVQTPITELVNSILNSSRGFIGTLLSHLDRAAILANLGTTLPAWLGAIGVYIISIFKVVFWLASFINPVRDQARIIVDYLKNKEDEIDNLVDFITRDFWWYNQNQWNYLKEIGSKEFDVNKARPMFNILTQIKEYTEGIIQGNLELVIKAKLMEEVKILKNIPTLGTGIRIYDPNFWNVFNFNQQKEVTFQMVINMNASRKDFLTRLWNTLKSNESQFKWLIISVGFSLISMGFYYYIGDYQVAYNEFLRQRIITENNLLFPTVKDEGGEPISTWDTTAQQYANELQIPKEYWNFSKLYPQQFLGKMFFIGMVSFNLLNPNLEQNIIDTSKWIIKESVRAISYYASQYGRYVLSLLKEIPIIKRIIEGVDYLKYIAAELYSNNILTDLKTTTELLANSNLLLEVEPPVPHILSILDEYFQEDIEKCFQKIIEALSGIEPPDVVQGIFSRLKNILKLYPLNIEALRVYLPAIKKFFSPVEYTMLVDQVFAINSLNYLKEKKELELEFEFIKSDPGYSWKERLPEIVHFRRLQAEAKLRGIDLQLGHEGETREELLQRFKSESNIFAERIKRTEEEKMKKIPLEEGIATEIVPFIPQRKRKVIIEPFYVSRLEAAPIIEETMEIDEPTLPFRSEILDIYYELPARVQEEEKDIETLNSLIILYKKWLRSQYTDNTIWQFLKLVYKPQFIPYFNILFPEWLNYYSG